MKTNRSLLILAAAFAAACFVPAVQAQPEGKPRRERPPHGERADAMRDHMAKALNLTAEQQSQIKAIHEKEREQRQAIMAAAGEDRAQVREKMKALREATVQQVDAVLTPEQQVKARELRAQGKEKMKERGEKMKERKQRRQTEN